MVSIHTQLMTKPVSQALRLAVSPLLLLLLLLLPLTAVVKAEPAAAVNATGVCQTDDCWQISSELYATLDPTADPCQDFEGFLCGGFRQRNPFTDGEQLAHGSAILDYMRVLSRQHSRRITEMLAFVCWQNVSACGAGEVANEAPTSSRLRAYEEVARQALLDCARIESPKEDNGTSYFGRGRSLREVVKHNIQEIVEEAIDVVLGGFGDPNSQSLESFLATQSRRRFPGPLVALENVAFRHGKPILLLLTGDLFTGLNFAPQLLANFPMQEIRLAQRLGMPIRLRPLVALVRHKKARLLLQRGTCFSAAERIRNSNVEVKTLGDAKRLLRRLGVATFKLDEFLDNAGVTNVGGAAINDSTPLLLSSELGFAHVMCMLSRERDRPSLIRLLTLHQFAHLVLDTVLVKPEDSCVDVLFGAQSEDKTYEKATEGAFRPMLHARYARRHAQRLQAAEDEARSLFRGLKEAYARALEEQAWISDAFKATLAERIRRTELSFVRHQLLDEESMERHYASVLDSMPSRGCTLAKNPACLLVRAAALRRFLRVGYDRGSFDQATPHYRIRYRDIVIAQPFLDQPYYRPGLPMGVRLGSLGFVLGHEATHSVLEEYWKKGWPTAFASGYQERESCLSNQLVRVFGFNKTSLEEEVSDRVGQSVALKMLKFQGSNGTNIGNHERLPGYMARFSPQQLFHISGLRIFCTKGTQSFWRRYESVADAQTHLIGRHRIRGLFAGSDELRRAFGCRAPVSGFQVSGDGGEDCVSGFW